MIGGGKATRHRMRARNTWTALRGLAYRWKRRSEMTVAILVIGLLALAVIFGWAAGKVRSLAMAVVLQMGCFIFLALAVIVAGAAITGGAG